ncbi:demethoxyubiquinone hydroxylase family protein [Roseateles sp. DC23W]|uniref:Demethoxyubiquinone hydroxylase family protein n=1 Tax=Pelomonas dachongensis TaxID=3299029 RepID=A0ABW7EVG5_9BURK
MSAPATDLGDTDLGARILKVNHAGENGAVHIYLAQAAVARLTAPGMVGELNEFRSHEERHRAIFWAELQRRGRPPCRSYALCALGGWVLGLVTGLLGRAAIAATTVAVERVVLRHLKVQIAQLEASDPAAVRAIAAIVADEQRHHDELAAQVTGGLWVRLLEPVVADSTETVIWLGMKR